MDRYFVADTRGPTQWMTPAIHETGPRLPSQRGNNRDVATGPYHNLARFDREPVLGADGRRDGKPWIGASQILAQQRTNRPSDDSIFGTHLQASTVRVHNTTLHPDIYNDPAFSSDPHLHPDHFTGIGKTSPKPIGLMTPDESPPPPYQLTELDDFKYTRSETTSPGAGSHGRQVDHSHVADGIRNVEGREVGYSAQGPGLDDGYIAPGGVDISQLSSTSSRSPYIRAAAVPMPSPSPSPSPTTDDEDSSLPYLRDDPPQTQSQQWANNQALSFLDPVSVPAEHYDPYTSPMGQAPRSLRTRSNPYPESNSEQPPSLPRRGQSVPHVRRGPDLDRIDELDESNPYGVAWHHGGPYDLTRPKIAAPLHPAYPSRDGIMTGATQGDQHGQYGYRPTGPPAPVPFKLNLQPGEILVRPPADAYNQQAGYREPLAPIHPRRHSPAYQNIPPNDVDRPRRPSPENMNTHELVSSQKDPGRRSSRSRGSSRVTTPVSPPEINSGYTPPVTPAPAKSQDVAVQRSSRSSSTHSSLRHPRDPYSASSSAASTPSVTTPPSGVSTDSLTNSSRAPTVRSRADGPPPSSRHVPKRLVMPAPLQHLPNPYGEPPTQPPRANVIPVRASDKANLLKKRDSTSKSVQNVLPVQNVPPLQTTTKHKHEKAEKAGKVEKVEKAPRRLSKRKNNLL